MLVQHVQESLQAAHQSTARISHPHSASPFNEVLQVSPVSAQGTLTTWKPLAQSKNKQPRVPESWTVSQNNKMQNGIHSCEKSQSHAFSSPAITFHHWEHCDTGSQFFGSWIQLTHNSLGSFHYCPHAVVSHCILCLQILHGAWIVRHDVQQVVAITLRQHKVFPPQGNGNPSSVLNHSIIADSISPCKLLFVVRLKPDTAIFEMLMLPKQHLTSPRSFKMRSRKLHLLVSFEMQTPLEQDRGSLKANYVIFAYRKQLESWF